ncbi:hypothetical protein KC730_01165 [Candidatus Kaiserbacteria bacterium]|nr:hypothetical protein [Candidatus Kaiserbacteria bacterium]
MKISSISIVLIKNFKVLIFAFIAVSFYFSFSLSAEAASLSVSPNTGVYTSNGTFSVQVKVNTDGKPINAADGVLAFNPKELSVVSVSRSSSIFNLWVSEPTFSNSAGTISFSGGSPAGYSGQTGNILTVTFRAVGSGTARVNFTSGSVLANDGRGTNVLTSMNSGTFTIQPASLAPIPEVIEYVAPANTPSAPKISSNSHSDPSLWYNESTAKLEWVIPSDVISVRTLLDDVPTSIPTKVYENSISSITLSDLPEGVSYFHLQFKNQEGWGKVTHYRLAIDTQRPTSFNISQKDNSDLSNPVQEITYQVTDQTSLVTDFKIKIDSTEPYSYRNETGTTSITLPALEPGYHSLIIEAFDQAGNSIIASYSFTILAFDKPQFTEYPNQINEEVIPVLRGLTRPNSEVEISVRKVGSEPTVYKVNSDSSGQFVFIPEGTFSLGVYELSAVATDEFGAKSEESELIKIAVQQPGYLKIGSLIINVLSVLIPLILLSFILIAGLWYLILYSRRFRKRVRIESSEALEILRTEFTSLQTTLRKQESIVQKSRRTGKLTKAESDMIQVLDLALQASQRKVEKEIADITELSKKNKKN